MWMKAKMFSLCAQQQLWEAVVLKQNCMHVCVCVYIHCVCVCAGQKHGCPEAALHWKIPWFHRWVARGFPFPNHLCMWNNQQTREVNWHLERGHRNTTVKIWIAHSTSHLAYKYIKGRQTSPSDMAKVRVCISWNWPWFWHICVYDCSVHISWNWPQFWHICVYDSGCLSCKSDVSKTQGSRSVWSQLFKSSQWRAESGQRNKRITPHKLPYFLDYKATVKRFLKSCPCAL